MRKNKILSLILAICLIIPCALVFTACGKDKDIKGSVDAWDGTTATVSEAVDNIITIETAEELAGLAKSVNAGTNYAGVTIKLAKDLDLRNKAWTPIGLGNRSNLAEAKMFAGTFDGNGKKIIGLSNEGYIPAESNKKVESDFAPATVYTYQYGLFGLTENATIKNLTISVDFECDDDLLKGDSVGGLVGFANKALTIDNCVVRGSVEGYDAIGGLVGRAYNSSADDKVLITNSVNKAEVEGLFKAAGIVGYLTSASLYAQIDNCANSGDVSVDGLKIGNAATSMVAGIVNYGWGLNENTLVITNNKNSGELDSVEQLTIGIDNFHSYAYVANSVSHSFNDTIHNYNFQGNSNTGVIEYLDVAATDALIVVHTQSYPEYDAEKEYNNKTNIDG